MFGSSVERGEQDPTAFLDKLFQILSHQQTGSWKNGHAVVGDPQVKPHMGVGPQTILDSTSASSVTSRKGKKVNFRQDV